MQQSTKYPSSGIKKLLSARLLLTNQSGGTSFSGSPTTFNTAGRNLEAAPLHTVDGSEIRRSPVDMVNVIF